VRSRTQGARLRRDTLGWALSPRWGDDTSSSSSRRAGRFRRLS